MTGPARPSALEFDLPRRPLSSRPSRLCRPLRATPAGAEAPSASATRCCQLIETVVAGASAPAGMPIIHAARPRPPAPIQPELHSKLARPLSGHAATCNRCEGHAATTPGRMHSPRSRPSAADGAASSSPASKGTPRQAATKKYDVPLPPAAPNAPYWDRLYNPTFRLARDQRLRKSYGPRVVVNEYKDRLDLTTSVFFAKYESRPQ